MATNPMSSRQLVPRVVAVLALVAFGVLPSASAQDIVVTSAEPPEAEQATVNLDVTIIGSGFAKGAGAAFLVTGTENPGGITVNRTTFVNTKKLIANIDVAETAVIGSFDIEVTSKGRTGKGIDLFSVKELSSTPPTDFLAGADFRDASEDGVTSDGFALPAGCGTVDYVDVADPCGPSIFNVSNVSAHGYFLRTVSNHEPLTVDRWLVVDFSQPYGDYHCPGLDTQLIGEIEGEIAEDPRNDPLVRPPENTDPCIDYVEVRFTVEGAFQPGVSQTPVNMLIDTPVRILSKNKNVQPYTQWNARFILNFVNSLSLSYGPGGEAIVGADGDDFRTELWTFDEQKGTFGEFLGFYTMPIQLTITNRE
jgi:hypothetical protein